jgi:hypothetical protein
MRAGGDSKDRIKELEKELSFNWDLNLNEVCAFQFSKYEFLFNKNKV